MKEEINTANYCTFYLVRHGEAEGNAKGEMMGHIDLPLTEKGRAQVEELNSRLKSINFDAIYSSDLLRAKQTAEILNKERNIILKVSELIRERSYGAFEGRPWQEYETKILEAKKQLKSLTETMGRTHHDLIGVENNEKLVKRMITFIREIAVTNPSKTVLIVAHGGIFRTFLAHIGFADYEALGMGAIGNAAYIKLLSDGTDFIVKETSGVRLPNQ